MLTRLEEDRAWNFEARRRLRLTRRRIKVGFLRAAGRGTSLASLGALVARISSVLETIRLLTEIAESPIDFSATGSMARTGFAVATRVTSEAASKLGSLT